MFEEADGLLRRLSVLQQRQVELLIHKVHQLPCLAISRPGGTVSAVVQIASSPSHTMH